LRDYGGQVAHSEQGVFQNAAVFAGLRLLALPEITVNLSLSLQAKPWQSDLDINQRERNLREEEKAWKRAEWY
jgi:hypothetical protein